MQFPTFSCFALKGIFWSHKSIAKFFQPSDLYSGLAVLLLSKSLSAKASNISSGLHKDCTQPRNKNESLIESLPNFAPLMNFFILHSTSTVQNIFFLVHLFSNWFSRSNYLIKSFILLLKWLLWMAIRKILLQYNFDRKYIWRTVKYLF